MCVFFQANRSPLPRDELGNLRVQALLEELVRSKLPSSSVLGGSDGWDDGCNDLCELALRFDSWCLYGLLAAWLLLCAYLGYYGAVHRLITHAFFTVHPEHLYPKVGEEQTRDVPKNPYRRARKTLRRDNL